MKKEEIEKHEESVKKEWNAPQINELGIDNTEGPGSWAVTEWTLGGPKSS